jgi:hypothetical protein|tara:strand:- start:282 stop:734 length:453 start_codon:yes stop_codon:yes gene_type:complete
MWYNKVVADLAKIPDFIRHYEKELDEAKKETYISGSLERAAANLPGITEHRFNQLQEIEAVLNFLNIELRKIRRTYFQKYLEGYQRALSSRDAEKYVDGEDDVIHFETFINEVALLRNKWLGLMKGLESKNFMIGHVVRLRTAGMEDIVL